ncbi:MAG: hypothetical protein KJO07_12620 [Deltaproteobacteria bacterium]|nr:hypothetical protein [Deltaproteobacteria bacterium]
MILALTCLAPLGCNQSETGAAGNIRFTPNNCGRPGGCDFNDGIAVGGLIDVTIDGIGGFPTAGLDLYSDDPNVFDVVPTADVASQPAWEIVANGDGIARLYAEDGVGDVDFIEVDVRTVAGLTLINTIGNAVGPQDGAPDYDEIWTIQGGDALVFWVYPVDDLGINMMGRFEYTVTLDPDIEDNLDNLEPESGRLAWTAPLGSGAYEATFDNGDDFIDVLFDAPL